MLKIGEVVSGYPRLVETVDGRYLFLCKNLQAFLFPTNFGGKEGRGRRSTVRFLVVTFPRMIFVAFSGRRDVLFLSSLLIGRGSPFRAMSRMRPWQSQTNETVCGIILHLRLWMPSTRMRSDS